MARQKEEVVYGIKHRHAGWIMTKKFEPTDTHKAVLIKVEEIPEKERQKLLERYYNPLEKPNVQKEKS